MGYAPYDNAPLDRAWIRAPLVPSVPSSAYGLIVQTDGETDRIVLKVLQPG